MSRDPQLAQIHIAQKELGLDDETYRAILFRKTQKESAKEMSSKERQLVIQEFKRLGFVPKNGFTRGRPQSNKPYVRKVFALWGELKRAGIWREPDASSLRHFVEKLTNCSDPEWLSFQQASAVIEALKKMKERHNG